MGGSRILAAVYSGLNLNQDKATKPQTVNPLYHDGKRLGCLHRPRRSPFNRHGSGFLWIGLPLFFAGALIAAIVGTASRPRLLSLDKSALQAFWASLRWSFLGTIWLLMIDPVSLLTVIAFVWICNQLVHFIDRKTSGQAQTENHPSDS